ncbi:MAG: winged helix-turn-helix domain-containing protein [Thiobacillaceae bacterium]
MDKTLQAHGRVWLTLDGKNFMGLGRAELLRRIAETGSIARAAKAMRMSYKAAWDAVDAMNTTYGHALVESATGGSRGGGSLVTPEGLELLRQYEKLQRQHQSWLVRTSKQLRKVK